MTTHVYTDQQLLDGLNRYRRLQKTVPIRTLDEALPLTFTKEARARPASHPGQRHRSAVHKQSPSRKVSLGLRHRAYCRLGP